ncbi:MAG: hypothetical protein IKN15_05835 [Bacteroidaceae bacterium]|nr:hypothetical protein [Bacteroidaceae bacterium]
MKKYLLTMCTIILFAIGFASSTGPTEEENSFEGTYVLTDADGVKWTFTFTCGDPTNQVTALKEGMNEDDMYYGEWSSFFPVKGSYLLDFRDFHAGNPEFKFPDGKINFPGEWLHISSDGWLYKELNTENIESKNPNKRIKINKK